MRDFSIDLIWAKIQVAFTAIGGWIGWFLGGVDGMMIALIVLMVLDYLSGVMCVIEDKKLSSAMSTIRAISIPSTPPRNQPIHATVKEITV